MKKFILSVLLLPIFALSFDNYEYEFSTNLGITDEIKANRDTVYPNLGFSIAKNIKTPLFDQIDFSIYKSKEITYNDNTTKTYVNRYLINFYQNRKISNSFSLYSLIGGGFREFSKKMGTEDSKYINYGLGLKYKLSNRYYIKTDARHMIQSSNGEHSFMYNVAISIPFGMQKQRKRIFIFKKENNDFKPFR